ncbi:hypothetical protein ACF0H5_023789 [Mactra antiquata]
MVFGFGSCKSDARLESNKSSIDIHTRRRGLIPNSRRRGDSHVRDYKTIKVDKLVDILRAKQPDVDNELIKNQNKSIDFEIDQKIKGHRRRRWDYDDTYDWENGWKDYDALGEEKKESAFEKFAKNWQKHALKVIFIFCVCATICICCIGCCKKCCGKIWATICWHCKDWRDLALNRDPTFRKARKFADDYGIELDYGQYKKIKKNYEDGFKRQGKMEYANLSGR